MKKLARVNLATVTLLLCALSLPPELFGQGKPKAVAAVDDDVIQLNVEMVALNVTVVDPNGNFVIGLDRNNFEIYEDKVKQEIASFAREDMPLNVGIIFDLSGSMKNKMRSSHDALRSFTRVCREDDQIFLLGFNNRLHLLRDFTSDDGAILASVLGAETKGRTALYDAVYMGLEKSKQGRHPRKVVLVISDGQDNSSRYTLKEIERLAQESDVEIYCIGIMSLYDTMTMLDLEGAEAMTKMAEITGGKAFFPRTQDELDAVCTYIALELRSQYSLSFISSNPNHDGKWRAVKVRVRAPRSATLNVRARTGYFAPR